MDTLHERRYRVPTSLLAAAALLCGCGNSTPAGRAAAPVVAVQDGMLPAEAACVLQSPLRQADAGLDAPGLRLEVPAPAAGTTSGPCQDNLQFRFGSGLYDITGVVANTSGMGWENLFQVFSGLHTRQYARAFAIESPCNGQRVLFVSADIGLLWPALRIAVLAALTADPELSRFYKSENVMLSVTHTHQGPAGYSHDDGGNLFHYGYDDLVFQTIVNGMVESIRLAHANIETHAQTAPIRLAVGELLNTNVNRSLPAFALNSEAERREFLDQRGEEVRVNKRFVQLNLVRSNGSAAGVINWFGVHPTVLGADLKLVSSDIKGYASLGFEKLMKTRYDAQPGTDDFVAAFAQTDEGDSSPNLYIADRPYPDPTRGGGRDEYESNAISGTKQLAQSLELFTRGAALSGPVDYRFFNVQMDQVTVDDPVVLASLQHPPELDAPVKRTCRGALGVSFIAGAEDGPAPGQEGVSCQSSPDVLAAAAADAGVLLGNQIPPYSPYGANYPTNLISALLLCQADQIPGFDFSCQAEKPVLIPSGQPVLPFQLFRIGNLAILGLPWEVTTISARRIRRLLLAELAPTGVDTVVISGLTNDYVNYLTTREEYSSQQYEGASTLFGPWSLAAVQQETRRLAIALRDGAPAPAGPAAAADATPTLIRTPYVPSDTAGAAGSFGALVSDVPPTAAPGATVRAEWQAGHPRNDLRTQASYVYAERQNADGNWTAVATDRDPELLYVWKPVTAAPLPLDPALTGPSTAEAVWTLPRNTVPGLYRLRHVGAAQGLLPPLQTYEGVSSVFAVAGPVAACP